MRKGPLHDVPPCQNPKKVAWQVCRSGATKERKFDGTFQLKSVSSNSEIQKSPFLKASFCCVALL